MGEKANTNSQKIATIQFNFPPHKDVCSKKVLTEDEFSQTIGQIIERDFFPDIPRLQAQSEYFEALDKNDLVKLREIQIRFSQSQRDTEITNRTPSTFETPDGSSSSNNNNNNRSPAPQPQADIAESLLGADHCSSSSSRVAGGGGGEASIHSKDKDAPKLSLDTFLLSNTSEDSTAFLELLKEADRKHRLKHSWLFEQEQQQQQEHEEMLMVPSIEEQAAITHTDTTTHINSWKYENKNAVMYVPQGVDLSPSELIQQQKQKARKIVHENTRFQHNPFSNSKSKEAMQRAASFRALINQGKIGHDGKELQSGESPQINGYSFVSTPSPAPGVSESPLMTWGEIESTPTRLDINNECQVSSTPGPVFRIPAVPKRDRLAMELSEKASRAHRAKKEEAIKQVTRRFVSPSPTSKLAGLSSAERLSTMSPAAQRLANKRLGIKTSTDTALQASYTPSPSPSHRLPGTATPIRLTPGSRSHRGAGSTSTTPGSRSHRGAVSTPNSGHPAPTTDDAAQEISLTDHLLNLPKRKRKLAADFF